jgi:peptidoglycan-associated lipoprotein
MKRSINRFLPVLFAGMCVYTGCASQEVVKNDSSLASTATKPAETASIAQNTTTPQASGKTQNANATSLPIGGGDQQNFRPKNEPGTKDAQQNSFDRIYFDFDSSTLNSAARHILDKNYSILKQNPQSRVRVEGHCDEHGSGEYNLALGERRAQAAIRYLTTMGVQSGQLSAISFGKERPADPGHDEAAWARNRRDEFILSK